MTSSLPRKPRITAWSRTRLLTAALAAGLLLGCTAQRREVLLTYFNADHGLSIRYPASWRTEQAEQEGIWYRYFLAPPAGSAGKSSVSVTLLAGPLTGPLDDYAQSYLAGNPVAAFREDSRQGAKGKAYRFASSDGSIRYSLLLLQEQAQVYGLFSQGDAASFTAQLALLDEMEKSLTLERPASYALHQDDKFGFSLRVPPSWREARHFYGSDSFVQQFTSPPLLVEKGQTVHASLTVTVEPVPAGGDLDAYYKATRDKQGESFQIINHGPWKDGYLDLMRAETPMATSRVKRFYRASSGRGYSLTFEAREDAYGKVSRWCDLIAGTFKVGAEVAQP